MLRERRLRKKRSIRYAVICVERVLLQDSNRLFSAPTGEVCFCFQLESEFRVVLTKRFSVNQIVHRPDINNLVGKRVRIPVFLPFGSFTGGLA